MDKAMTSLINSITEQEATEVLSPHFSAIHECITSAFDRWHDLAQVVPHLHAPLTKRTRASFVNDFMTHLIREQFGYGRVKGAELREKNGVQWLSVNSRVVVRFKKLNSQGISSNIRTRHQEALAKQIVIAGMPDQASRMTIGYILNKSGSAIRDVRATFPLHGRHGWQVGLLDVIIDLASQNVVMPFEGSGADQKPRVRPFSIEKDIDENQDVRSNE